MGESCGETEYGGGEACDGLGGWGECWVGFVYEFEGLMWVVSWKLVVLSSFSFFPPPSSVLFEAFFLYVVLLFFFPSSLHGQRLSLG